MQLTLQLKTLFSSSKFRYLIAGGWNTVFGYATGLLLYSYFSTQLHVVVISILSNIIAITMSFTTYKLIVFQTKGHWIKEYLRSYVVYGGMALIGTGLIWLFVDGFGIKFWLAQALVIFTTVCISYLGHKYFTFKK